MQKKFSDDRRGLGGILLYVFNTHVDNIVWNNVIADITLNCYIFIRNRCRSWSRCRIWNSFDPVLCHLVEFCDFFSDNIIPKLELRVAVIEFLNRFWRVT